jgi:serine/threonine-protein kinase
VVIGADKRVRILDFGVGFLLTCERGKSLLDTMTNTKTLARGLDCAAPETHLNPLDRTPAGDRYSLGCVLFYCLTGQYPFPEPNPLKKMLAHQTAPPPNLREINPAVSGPLAAVVEQLLSKTPDDRYYTTDELVEALRELLARPGALTGGKPVARKPEAKREAGARETKAKDAPRSAGGGLAYPVLIAGVGVGVAVGCLIAFLMARW